MNRCNVAYDTIHGTIGFSLGIYHLAAPLIFGVDDEHYAANSNFGRGSDATPGRCGEKLAAKP